MSNSTAPRQVERMLEGLGADTDFRQAVLGDLAEEFALRARLDGPAAARRWYYRESVRVAPYLLREWWRDLGWSDASYFARVVVLSSLVAIVLERVIQFSLYGLVTGASLARFAANHFVPFFILTLSWSLLDGVVAGYLAARLGRRAPLASVVALAAVWIVVMTVLLSQGPAVAIWFRVANAVVGVAGMFAGGMLRVSGGNAQATSRPNAP